MAQPLLQLQGDSITQALWGKHEMRCVALIDEAEVVERILALFSSRSAHSLHESEAEVVRAAAAELRDVDNDALEALRIC